MISPRNMPSAPTAAESGFIEWLATEQLADRHDDCLGHVYRGCRSEGGLNP
jgi:hypothetical protein